MEINYRVCPECNKQQKLEKFLPVANSSPYGLGGMSYICVDCISKKINRKDLATLDKMCQFLDLPYDANRWIELEQGEDDLRLLLIKYCQEMTNGKYADNDWFRYNKMWQKCREYDTVLDQLTSIHNDLLLFLRKKWGHIDNFNLEDYMRMEEYERHTLSHYPFKDEARRDMVRKLAKLSAVADKEISNGNNREATTILQSYNTLMRELGIKTETTSGENTINSLSELVAYLERTGFLLNYRITENRDIVDKTIANMQQYVKRLFTDSSETVNEMYNSKILSSTGGTDLTDEDIENLYASTEEEVDYVDTMNEQELEKMFTQVENEFK